MKKINKEIVKLIEIIQDQETLTSVSCEKENLGHKKSRRTEEDLKDKEIEILKLKYDIKNIFTPPL
jgi:hypothetical protein